MNKLIFRAILFAVLFIQHLLLFKINTQWALYLYFLIFIYLIYTKTWSQFQFFIMLILMYLLPGILPRYLMSFSAYFLFILFFITSLITLLIKPARANLKWFRIGTIDKKTVLLMIITSVADSPVKLRLHSLRPTHSI